MFTLFFGTVTYNYIAMLQNILQHFVPHLESVQKPITKLWQQIFLFLRAITTFIIKGFVFSKLILCEHNINLNNFLWHIYLKQCLHFTSDVYKV